MPTKSKRLCQHPGCPNLTTDRFCPAHAADEMLLAKQRERAEDRRRGTAAQRGYTARWARYAKAYLARPENKFCVLHLDDGCAGVAQCVDHIVPPASPEDPLFWEGGNHQPACIHCNSVKGRKKIIGTYIYGEQSRGPGGGREI